MIYNAVLEEDIVCCEGSGPGGGGRGEGEANAGGRKGCHCCCSLDNGILDWVLMQEEKTQGEKERLVTRGESCRVGPVYVILDPG